jgi:multidrug efflux pump subunit AcrA (membrane-fusion protein)
MASGASLLAQKEKTGADRRSKPNPPDVRADKNPVHEVKPGIFNVSVAAAGFVEASRNQVAFSPVEGSTRILQIVPEGRHVKKGEIVCELDSAALKSELAGQLIARNRAEADYQAAKLAREAAELAANRRIEGVYQSELDRLNREIAAARSAIQDAEHRLARTRRTQSLINNPFATNRAAHTSADIVAEQEIEDRIEAAELILKNEQTALERAKTRRDLIEQHRPEKAAKALDVDAARKHLSELAMRAALELEMRKIAKLQDQITACTLVAHVDGHVVYAIDRNWRNPQTAIKQGATVRQRQKIFSIPDLDGPLQVHTRVPGAMIRQVAPGQRARIKVDAFPELTLEGVVGFVSSRPDASSYLERELKFHSTTIEIAKGPAGLRPGMSAQVEILVARFENALSVPLRAVLRRDGKIKVAVQTRDGGFVWREVVLGVANETSVEIRQGIEPGDRVALSPLDLLIDRGAKAPGN